MTRQFINALSSAALALLIAGCSSSDNTTASEFESASVSGRPDTNQPESIFETFIAPARSAAHPANNATNLLNNSGFENGTAFWEACLDGSVSMSSDAYQGNSALSIDSPSCLYQVVEAQPGESYALSCFVKLTELEAWTGMGMTFSNVDYQSVATAPSATATAGEYTKIETLGTATADTAFVGMWIYSEHGAVVDNCALTLADDRTTPVPSADSNLLSNADFSETIANNQAADWLSGCGGSTVADGSSLYLADGACVDQALSAEAVQTLQSQTAVLSCFVAEYEGFSDMSVFFDNTVIANKQISSVDVGQRVNLAVPEHTPSNAFVSAYSEGFLRIQDCRLEADATVVAEVPESSEPTDTSTPDPVNTPAQTARYRVTFNATWSGETHPVNFPFGNPHFSPLTGVTHNDQIQFWAPQLNASQGIKVVAETGNPTEFLNEINAIIRDGNAASTITGGGIAESPGSVSVEFEISSDFPLVTFATMIAPSPDWFLGVHDLALYENGVFVDSLTAPLIAYDSGTDSGVTYTSADLPTLPAVGISRVNSDPADSSFQSGLPAAGELVFERLQ